MKFDPVWWALFIVFVVIMAANWTIKRRDRAYQEYQDRRGQIRDEKIKGKTS